MTHITDSGWRERFIEGGWIPPSREALRDSITHKVPHSPRTPYLHPTVQELKRLIDEDPEVYMGFHDMLAQKAADPVGPSPCAKFWAVNWLLDYGHSEFVRHA